MSFPKEAVRGIIITLSGLPSTNVLWDGEPIPFIAPKNGVIQGTLKLSLTAVAKMGRDENKRTYNVDGSTTITNSGPRQYTLTVRSQSFGSESFDVISDLALALEDLGTCDLFESSAGLAMASVLGTRDISGGGNDALAASAFVDVLLNGVETRVTVIPAPSGGYIETVAPPSGDITP